MPCIKIEISKQPEEKKRELVKQLTKISSEITGINENAFTIFINEYETENIGVSGELLVDKLRSK